MCDQPNYSSAEEMIHEVMAAVARSALFLPFFRQFARTADVIAISLVHEIKCETFISFMA